MGNAGGAGRCSAGGVCARERAGSPCADASVRSVGRNSWCAASRSAPNDAGADICGRTAACSCARSSAACRARASAADGSGRCPWVGACRMKSPSCGIPVGDWALWFSSGRERCVGVSKAGGCCPYSDGRCNPDSRPVSSRCAPHLIGAVGEPVESRGLGCHTWSDVMVGSLVCRRPTLLGKRRTSAAPMTRVWPLTHQRTARLRVHEAHGASTADLMNGWDSGCSCITPQLPHEDRGHVSRCTGPHHQGRDTTLVTPPGRGPGNHSTK